MSKETRREQIKLRATFINNMAVAVFAAGALTPMIAWVSAVETKREVTLMILTAIVCFGLAFFLHIKAVTHLEGLDS